MPRSTSSVRVGATLAGLSALIACGVFSDAWGQVASGVRNAVQPTCDRATFHVAIDVGHSAKEGGARSARGASEYEFNLRLATQIVQALLDQGFANTTLLITEDPKRSGLLKRVERANKMAADLFLSIHHDALSMKRFLFIWREVEKKEGSGIGRSKAFQSGARRPGKITLCGRSIR